MQYCVSWVKHVHKNSRAENGVGVLTGLHATALTNSLASSSFLSFSCRKKCYTHWGIEKT